MRVSSNKCDVVPLQIDRSAHRLPELSKLPNNLVHFIEISKTCANIHSIAIYATFSKITESESESYEILTIYRSRANHNFTIGLKFKYENKYEDVGEEL